MIFEKNEYLDFLTPLKPFLFKQVFIAILISSLPLKDIVIVSILFKQGIVLKGGRVMSSIYVYLKVSILFKQGILLKQPGCSQLPFGYVMFQSFLNKAYCLNHIFLGVYWIVKEQR